MTAERPDLDKLETLAAASEAAGSYVLTPERATLLAAIERYGFGALIRQARLGAAWEEAVAALPPGEWFDLRLVPGPNGWWWEAAAVDNVTPEPPYPGCVTGQSPEEVLHNLAVALRERQP
jgi:hypothetical protein